MSKLQKTNFQLEDQIIPHNKKEGLNPIYTVLALSWIFMGRSCSSLKMKNSIDIIKNGLKLYEDQLTYDLELPDCQTYQYLINNGYLKKKHWIYADYMATISSLPLLYKVQEKNVIQEAIIAKTSIGTSTKLLDNLNDSVQTVDEAISSLKEFGKAMTEVNYEIPRIYSNPISMNRATNTSYVIGNWVPKILVRCNAPKMYKIYVKDVNKLINGQIDSINHKRYGDKKNITINNFLTSISEKSIGDVWVDIDLCFIEDGLGKLDTELMKNLEELKKGYSWIFKSSLIYDDVQDIYSDIKENAINSTILLGLKEGVIKKEEINQSDPNITIKKLDESKISSDTIFLADMLFMKGIRAIEKISKNNNNNIIDWDALLLSFRFVRLFNLRKILMRKKNREIFNQFISSIRNFNGIEEKIPDHILELGKCLDSEIIYQKNTI